MSSKFRRVLKRLFSNFYQNFINLKGEPNRIATAFAIGIFIGFFPILGTHTPAIILLSSTARIHFAGMYIAAFLPINPITMGPVFVLEFYVGKMLLNKPDLMMPEFTPSLSFVAEAGRELAINVIVPMVLGGIVIGIVFALLSYPLARWLVIKNNQRGTVPQP